MPLSRCFSSLGCPDYSLEDTLLLADAHGIPAVELRTLGGTVDLPGYFGTRYGVPERLAAEVPTAPARVAALDASLRLVGGVAAEREELLALAPWADVLGVRWLRVFDGGKTAAPGEVAEAAETIRWWRDTRRARGWQADLMVETHDSLLTAESIARLTAAIPEVAVLWDAHHTWRKGGEDPLVTWPAIRRSVVHVHVKDSVDRPSARHPFTYVLPGEGGFPIRPLREALVRDGYAGLVSLEWERMWHPYLPPLEEALRVADETGWW